MPLTLYKRGDIWHCRGTVAGRRLRRTTGTSSKETAQRVANELEGKQWKCRFDGPEAVLTFAQAALSYAAAGKETRFLTRISAYWKDALIKNITAGAIIQSARELYPNASGATRNRQVIVPTQAVINHAAELGLCPRITIKRFTFTRKVKKPATIEWVRTFMQHSPPHLGALALFMLTTGARVSEALALQWKDVDFTARTALINSSKVEMERHAHLPQELIIAMSNIKRSRTRGVFRYTAKASADKSWRAAAKRAGLEPLSFHCCRHGFATALLQKGVDPVTIAKRGGWKNPAHIFQTYGHASDDPTITDLITLDTPGAQSVLSDARKPRRTA